MSLRLALLRLRRKGNWRLVQMLVLLSYLGFMFFLLVHLFGSNSTGTAYPFGSPFGDLPQSVLDFEAKFVPGAGENGRGVHLGDERLVQETVKKYAFNKLASDKIDVKRKLPDVRHADCKRIQYDENLPSASVIIIFNNEMLSTLVRTGNY